LLSALVCVSCEKPPTQDSNNAPPPPDPAVSSLRLELARHRPPAESLSLLTKNLSEIPNDESSLAAYRELLLKTTWQIPETTIDLGKSVDHLWTDSRSVWAAVSDGETNTAIRWNTHSDTPPSVLFPAPGGPIRSWHFNTDASRVLIDRDGILLLCDAQSLKPIHDLPPLPPDFIPASVVCFSREFPLFAHPVSGTSHTFWHIRDAATGEIVRAYEPPVDSPSPIAARMAGATLQLLHPGGTITSIPVSPAEPATTLPPSSPDHYREAIAHPDGFLSLAQNKPHAPVRMVILEPGKEPRDHTPSRDELLSLHAETLQPSLWTSPLPWDKEPSAGFSAKTRTGTHLLTGETNGRVIRHRILSPPALTKTKAAPSSDPAHFRALTSLLPFLSPTNPSGSLPSIDTPALQALFPDLSFDAWQSPAAAGASHSDPAVIRKALDERLHRFSERPTFSEIEEAFANADEAKVSASISNAKPSGAQAATCLHLALSSTRPAWIARCLSSFTNLPPLLTRIAHSRIAWLENRKADVIAVWPEPFPDYDHIRRTEDWDGWEAADFRIAFEQVRQSVDEELARLVVPVNATAEQRDAAFAHLTSEATLTSIGRARYARACLEAATRFAAFPEETERTFELAKIARSMGAPPAPCLRAEALALTALQDHARARDRWVELITHQPIADHQPGDYAEAAYSSFENSDPTQAMAILATGMHRYPQDAAFALRAGWIALLTAHPEAAYRFLLAGHRVGWPQDQAAHACALLAIASFQSGAPEESAAWFQELMRLDASWRDEKNITDLTWPDEIKAVLHHLAEHALVTPDR
jgi:tetratricopeptide (TPR) repeat protein